MSTPFAPAGTSSPPSFQSYDRGPAKILPQVDREQVPPEMMKAAQGFETIFLDQLMKTMRQTVPKNEMDLNSPASEIYQGMLDAEYADRAAKAGGVGLADLIVAYWSGDRYTYKPGHQDGAARTGGTDARRTVANAQDPEHRRSPDGTGSVR